MHEVYTQIESLELRTRHEEAQIQEIDRKSRDKDWDAVAAPLRKVGLYQAGCAAASAARKLGVRRPPTALYQQVSRLAWIDHQRLHPATAQGPTEGRSAELGLALVLLMCACGSPARQVIATGALGGQPAGVVHDDVEVLPVASLSEKLQLILTLARHGSLPGVGATGEMPAALDRRADGVGVAAPRHGPAQLSVAGLPAGRQPCTVGAGKAAHGRASSTCLRADDRRPDIVTGSAPSAGIRPGRHRHDRSPDGARSGRARSRRGVFRAAPRRRRSGLVAKGKR